MIRDVRATFDLRWYDADRSWCCTIEVLEPGELVHEIQEEHADPREAVKRTLSMAIGGYSGPVRDAVALAIERARAAR